MGIQTAIDKLSPLLDSFPELKGADLFLHGLSCYSHDWGLDPERVDVSLVCSIDSLQRIFGPIEDRINVREDGLNEILFEGGGCDFSVILHSDLVAFEDFLNRRPMNYQKAAFSLRLNRFFSGSENCPLQKLAQSGPIQWGFDQSEVIWIQLCQKKPLSALEGFTSSRFKRIGFQRFFEIGFVKWLREFRFVSYMVEDLMAADILDGELITWLRPMLGPLSFYERNASNLRDLQLKLMDSGKRLIIPYFRSEFEFKFCFLFQYSKVDFFEFEGSERELLGRLEEYAGWWQGILCNYEELDGELVAQWIDSFGNAYLESLMISSLHLFYRQHQPRHVWDRLTEILTEIEVEEKFVRDLIISNAQDPTDVSDKHLAYLKERWLGRLKTRRQLEQI